MRGVMPILKCEIYQVNTQNWSVETVVKRQYLNYKKWKTEEKERLIKWDKWDSSMSLWVGILVTTTWLFRAIFTIFLLLFQCCLLHSSSGIGKPSWHLKEENINRWVCCLSVCLSVNTYLSKSQHSGLAEQHLLTARRIRMVFVIFEPFYQRECSLRGKLVPWCIVWHFGILVNWLIARDSEKKKRERGLRC